MSLLSRIAARLGFHVAPTGMDDKGFPKVINFQANDICNLGCKMCNIWQQKFTHQVSPTELENILRDPFFSQVEHIGITGGEPTLRKDLEELYLVALRTLPRLQGASFITNGSLPTKALETYTRVSQAYREVGKSFSGMVSLDGVGPVHDRVRGKKVFDRTWQTLTELRAAGIECHACCTVVRSNVYDLQELLEFCQRHGVYVRFRVGEFIDRLYNKGLTDEIRAFTPQENAHLVSFFLGLIAGYEQDPRIHRTYRSIISILTGGPRRTRCPYQRGEALNLTSKGQFSYCAPKGELHDPAPDYRTSFETHLNERQRILEQHCSGCIHDYHDDYTPAELEEQRQDAWDRIRMELGSSPDSARQSPPKFADWDRVSVCGWYGTETAGDILILKGIIREIRTQRPDAKIQVISLFPEYTKTTVALWSPEEREYIEVYSYWDRQIDMILMRGKALIMGGGPLMDLPQTEMIADLFQWCAGRGLETVVWGCGLGPLHNPNFRRNVARILVFSSTIWLRDHASAALGLEIAPDRETTVIDDPSIVAIRATNIHQAQEPGAPVRLFLRELTHEYPQETTPERSFQGLCAMIRSLLDKFPDRSFELWHMHYLAIGGDDRIFARRLATKIGSPRLKVIVEPQTPEDVLRAMATSSLNISMRFHSVVFAQTLGTRFIAIDYTAGGKIAAFMSERNLSHLLVPLAALESQALSAVERAEADASYFC